MNKLLSLTLIQLKDFLGKTQSSLNVKNNYIGKILLVFFLIIIGFPAVNFSILMFNSFLQINRPELVITSMYVNSVMLMFFLSIPFIFSVFFFSKDGKFLASLPVKEETIVFSKLSTVYLYLLLVSTLLIAPSMVIYALNIGLNLSFVLLSIVALLLTPILPLMISALFVLTVSRFISSSKHRNLFSILSNILLIIGIIFIQLRITKYISQPEFLQNALLNEDGLLGLIGLRFPPSIWLTKMIMGSFTDALLFIGVNIIFIFVLQMISKLFFKRALLAYNEGNTSYKGSLYYIQRSKGLQLFKRHFFIICKEPMFLLNTVLTLLVPILLFVVMSFTGEMSMDLFRSPQLEPYMILILTGILVSPAVMGNISSTSITREGQGFWETKVLPISFRENIRYRILTTLVFNWGGSILLLVLSAFILPLSMEIVAPAIVFTVTTTLFLATIDIIVNIYRPLLNWTNPTAAVKNNMNIMISLGIRVLIGLAYYLVYKIEPQILTLDYNITVWVSSGIFFILYLVTRYLVYNYFTDRFSKISI